MMKLIFFLFFHLIVGKFGDLKSWRIKKKLKMNTEDYLTDASSLDALSTHGEDEEGDDNVFPLSPTTPTTHIPHHHHPHRPRTLPPPPPSSSSSAAGSNTTPTPLFSLLDIGTTTLYSMPSSQNNFIFEAPKTAYFVGRELSNDPNLLAALNVI